MTDVRLTATNPEDSSVVPVACNSRGELLIEEVKVEEIENDLTVDGSIKSHAPADLNQYSFSYSGVVGNGDGLYGGLYHHSQNAVTIAANGYRNSQNQWTSLAVEGSTSASIIQALSRSPRVVFRIHENWPTGSHYEPPIVFEVNQNGVVSPSVVIQPEGLAKTGGQQINVGEELVFLRAQVRALMEKLKMTPEGGWPVWDGSA